MIEVTAAANCDDVMIAWRIDSKLNGCIGFAIERDVDGGPPECLETSMPFDGQTAAPGEHRPSSQWPIQRFVWTDHLAPNVGALRYRVGPVTGTADNPQVSVADWSAWTQPVHCTTQQDTGLSLFPNRGIVAAPWIERDLEGRMLLSANHGKSKSEVLADSIQTAGDELRVKLAGPVLNALKAQFNTAETNGEQIYAALYELRDDELTDLLIKAGNRAHVIVANGAFTAAKPDPNEVWANRLSDAGIEVHRRLVQSPHYAHNKFVVFTNGTTATRVWTGSTNWTPSGLCTQANHAVLLEDPNIAAGFLAYWDRIRDQGSDYSSDYIQANSTAVQSTALGSDIAIHAWLVPVLNHVDLAEARARIQAAQHGALFLMFRPGNDHTLIDDIKQLHAAGKFIRGIVNTNFLGPNSAPTIQFFNKSAQSTHADPELILPDHLQEVVGSDHPELGVQGVLIHSKTIVLDPFSENPVVMTGSHNLGEKASESNDDNLVIIEGAHGLAREFAVYIMNVYDQYKWRYERGLRAKAANAATAGATPPANVWNGLKKTDSWQNTTYLAAAATEATFWFGN